jgi:hypothetical protein
VGCDFNSQISQQLIRVDGCVLCLGLSEVEHPLELTVVGVVVLVAVSVQVQVATALV